MAQPLPATLPLRVQRLTNGWSAYNTCLRIENSLQTAVVPNEGKLVYVRILGYLIHYVVSDHGLATITKEIVQAADEGAVIQLGKMYFERFIWAFRASKRGPNPITYHYTHCPSFDTIADMINDTLNEEPQDPKKMALIRDGYRCIVTGKYDFEAVEYIKELESRVVSDVGLIAAPTQLAHIFEVTTSRNNEPRSHKTDCVTSMWDILRHLGHDNLPESINGDLVHCLENVMTLSTDFRVEFDRLKVWFVPTEEKNKYKLEGANSWWLRQYPQYITFTTSDQKNYPLPNPVYLAIHAGCAKVSRFSGAAACIDKLERDMEDGEISFAAGAPGRMLHQAIFAKQACGHKVIV